MPDSFSNDLRCSGTQTKRLHDRKAKWAYGCRRIAYSNERLPRPAMPATHYRMGMREKRDNEHNLNKMSRAKTLMLRFAVREALDDSDSGSSGDERVEVEAVVGEPTPPEIIADTPEEVHGCDVAGHAMLSDAVDKAEEAFESKETEKMASEYEMVPRESEAEAEGGCMADDGFELVEERETG